MTPASRSVDRTNPPPRKAEGGFTFIGLMLIVLIMGITLSLVGEFWFMTQKREKEQQLLFVGDQFRRAITQYYEQSPAGPRRYPSTLDDLLKDPRTPAIKRYLRKIYVDPMTGTPDWGLLKNPNGEILGVFSLSEDEPAKKANFKHDDALFEKKTRYADWVFMPVPKKTISSPASIPGNPP